MLGLISLAFAEWCFRVVVPFYDPTSNAWEFKLIHMLTSYSYQSFFNFTYSRGYEWVSHCSLNCISLVAIDADNCSCVYWLFISIFFYEVSISPFFGAIIFSLLNYRSLYILESNLLSYIHIVSILICDLPFQKAVFNFNFDKDQFFVYSD